VTGVFIAQALRSGALQNTIWEELIPAYARRHGILLGAIQAHLAPLGVEVAYPSMKLDDPGSELPNVVAGGYFLYLSLPRGMSADVLTERVKEEENVIITPERMCRVPLNPGTSSLPEKDRFIRLCFAWEDESALTDGVKRIARVVKRLLEGSSSNIQKAPSENLNAYG
jgi:DNA-binding transcriptional MocR family regulator